MLCLSVPVAILFPGIIADPEETHAAWYGMLNTLGIFDLSALTDIERLTYAEKRHSFWFGEVEMAAILAGTFAAPVGIYMTGRTYTSLAFRCCGSVPAALCIPAKIDAGGYVSGYGCWRSRRSGRTSR